MASTLESSQLQSSNKSSSSSTPLSELADSARFWRSGAPQEVQSVDDWQAWAGHLGKRRDPKSLEKLCDTTEAPLQWGLSIAQLSKPSLELLSIAEKLNTQVEGKTRPSKKQIKQALSKWLKGTRSQPQTIDFALECLAVAHVLPHVADEVGAELWWKLLDALWQVVQSSAGWRIDVELPPEEGLAQQMLAGELPLTLTHLLPEMRPVHKLQGSAREALSEGVAELLNGDGLVRGTHLTVLRPLLACWTRCRALGESHKKNCWNRKAEDQYQCLVTHSIGLSSPTGTPLLGQPHDAAWTPDFLKTVLRLGGDAADLDAARSLLSKKLIRSLPKKKSRFVPETSDHCEWSGLAYLRTDWQRNEPTVVVDYSKPELGLEVWAGAQRLISGVWSWETTLDGKRLEPAGTWDESCWFSDEDVDYLELSIELSGGARLERQILLARNELFLLLSDYIIDTSGGDICHTYRLPLDTAVSFKPEKETREGFLSAGKNIARVMPLALPEWRTDPRVGQLTASEGQLELTQKLPGKNLACPLLIDLKKSRASRQCTWRQLTVAQSLEAQPHDVAVGYRAQCGKDQWLVYRSLAKSANRTVIGQNLSHECMVARFLAPSGEVDELLEIEAGEE